LTGPQGIQGPQGLQGPAGVDGTNGTNGVDGQDGLSAYETWLSQGNSGTEQDFINSLSSNNIGTQEISISNPSGSSQGLYTVQPYLVNYGTGINGNYVSTNGATLSTGQYSNFTIQAGHIVNLSGTTTTIMVKDTCRIFGSINGKGTDMACGGCNTCVGSIQNGAGGAGGASLVCYNSCGASCYHHGPFGQSLSWSVYGSMETNLNPLTYSYSIAPSQSISNDQLLNALQIRPQLHGGNGGWRCTGENSSGCGGKGLYIICKVLIFEGNIDLRGGIGRASTNSNCRDGAGGGGGGSAVISAKEIISNSGTIVVTGGTGGAGLSSGCAGQNGGAGSYVILDMP
jgi:hypothetical protein